MSELHHLGVDAGSEYAGDDRINVEDLIIRRSELDDAHTLNEIISSDESSSLDLLYNYPKALLLMETSALSVTILDKDENILGCVVFDASHEIITGMNDFMHENLWEDWLYSVFQIRGVVDITPYNSLWVKYLFIAGGVEKMDIETEILIVQKVFRFVYHTLPELEYILFHLRKEASSSHLALNYIRPVLEEMFEELERKDLPAEAKENLNLTSRVFSSHRSNIIKVLEIRPALEQDHDDLVEICNAQSELYTEYYGNYFIAELIANQNENRKAIVAQVDSKAKGLLSLSTDIDYAFLAKNFELEIYDNLCNYEFMDAIRFKRVEAEVEEKIKKEAEAREFSKQMHDFKILCSETANKMMLQQYCILRQNEIKAFLEEAAPETGTKKIQNKKQMEEVINNWLRDFKIAQPGQFFFDHPIVDVDFYGHIISEKDLFLDTLTYFGLPVGYIDGVGHWDDYKKKEQEKRKEQQKKKEMYKGTQSKATTGAGKKKGRHDDDLEGADPGYFNLMPLLDAFKNFVDNGPEVRTKIRMQIAEEHKKVTQLFCKPNGEPDPEFRNDILMIAESLRLDMLQPNQIEGFGWVLECFGNCTYIAETIKVPEKPKEENSDLKALRSRPKTIKKEQEKYVDKVQKKATYNEFKQALDKLAELDETLMRSGKIQSESLKRLVAEKEKEHEKLVQKKVDSMRAKVEVLDNPYIDLLKGKSEEEMMQLLPREARNAVAINIFFIDKAFESRSMDFLPFAFEVFPNVEYIILTQPFRGEESVLLQGFIPVPKRENTNISHTLYIYHRACLLSPYLTVRRSFKEDVEQGRYLLEGASNEKEFKDDLYDAIMNNASNKIAFSAFNQNAPIGFFVMTKDVNLEYYKSHFCLQYHLLMDQYELTDHSRLLHSVVNPLFQRSRRFLFREVLRLSNKKTLLFEVQT